MGDWALLGGTRNRNGIRLATASARNTSRASSANVLGERPRRRSPPPLARSQRAGAIGSRTTSRSSSAAIELETNSRQITPKHHGKPTIIRDQRTRPVNKIDNFDEICKTSIPGSNPGGASNFPQQNRSFASCTRKRTPRNWTTVDYKTSDPHSSRCRKPLVQSRMRVRGVEKEGGSRDLHLPPRAVRGCHVDPSI